MANGEVQAAISAAQAATALADEAWAVWRRAETTAATARAKADAAIKAAAIETINVK